MSDYPSKDQIKAAEKVNRTLWPSNPPETLAKAIETAGYKLVRAKENG